MSGFVSEPTRSDKALATTSHGEKRYTEGQRHDRLPDISGGAATMTMKDADDLPPETDISASQKMLSAVSGSLLTSLLGKFKDYQLYKRNGGLIHVSL